MFRRFNNLKIRNKLIMGFLIVILIGVAGLGWSILSISQIDAEIQDVVREAKELIGLEEVQVDLLEQEVAELEFLLTGDEEYLERHQRYETLTEQALDEALNLEIHEQGRETIRTLMEEKDQYKESFAEVVALYNEGRVEEAIQHSLDVSDLKVERVHEQVEEMISEGRHLMEEAVLQADQQAQTATLVAYVSMGVCLVLGVAIGFFLSTSIANAVNQMLWVSKQIAGGNVQVSIDVEQKDEVGQLADVFRQMIVYLQAMSSAADRLAQGDLTAEITPQSNKDMLGNAFAQMTANLRALVGQVTNSANNVGAASTQLTASAVQSAEAANQAAATIQQVAQGTAQQTQSVTQATTTVEQVSRAIEGVARGAQEQAAAVGRSAQITANISSAVQQVAVNAQSGAQSAAQTAMAARNGSETVAKTIKGMESIKASTDLVAQRVREMGQRSEQIGDIVETIDDIASQTNLLALNAAIEAARAGEHGKGFAVVADEVRKLAENSAIATKEISVLIKTIQQTIGEAVQAMDAGAAEVESGLGQAAEAGQVLDSILTAAEEVNHQVEEIAAAAQQMDASTNELVGAMDSVSAVVEENTASTEEMAAGAGEVSQAVENIAAISEENSAASEEVSATIEEVSAQVEEVTASAQSLSAMAEGLTVAVAQFKLRRGESIQASQILSPAMPTGDDGHDYEWMHET
ncbi:MAG: HAMP domain-containing protein [Chloroflexi bacterium]|nr:HAMP domain-containing protein [Chloroflexota bacterium]